VRKILIRLAGPLLQAWAKWYFTRPRSYHYKGVKGKVFPGVFFPHFTLSTRFLIDFIGAIDLKGKQLLELGCGTALISCYAAKNGAIVTASDINVQAIENAQFNAALNEVTLSTIHSDLFESIPQQTFDIMVINPPYYPIDPQNDSEKAWYCGSNFEYFTQLFEQLGAYMEEHSGVYMILSEDCQIARIKEIAVKKGFGWEEVQRRKRMAEENYIFQLKSIQIPVSEL
jgi:release factor glutamine methyltransferase